MTITRAAENSTPKSRKAPALEKPGPRSLAAINPRPSLRCTDPSSGRLRPLLLQPGVELGLGHDVRRLAYRRMPEPAQLRAHHGVVAGARRLHAVRRVDARHRVDLLAERRHPEVVDDVLGLDGELHLGVEREVELVAH